MIREIAEQTAAKLWENDDARVMLKQKTRSQNFSSALNNDPYNPKKTGPEFQYQMWEFVIPRKNLTMQVDVPSLTDRLWEKLLVKYKLYWADKYYDLTMGRDDDE